MSDYFFENQGTNTYLIFDISNDTIDNMSLGMITNNKINGFVPTIYTQIDRTKYLKYNVSARITMKEFFSGVVTRKRLLGVFGSIAEALCMAEDYMLDANSFLLDMEFIYIDVSLCNAEIICLPLIPDKIIDNDICLFFKNIMFSTQFDQTENCDYVIKIINYLNKSGCFSVNEFKVLLDELGKEAEGQKMAAGSTVLIQNSQPIPSNENNNIRTVINKPAVDLVQEKNTIPAVQRQSVQPKQNAQKSKKGNDNGRSVQVQSSVNVNVPQSAKVQNEKKMSMFYLLNHYNKENAAIYKAQKEEKKTSAKAKKDTAQKINSQQSVPKSDVKGAGFAVPGMQTPSINQNTNAQKPISKADGINGAVQVKKETGAVSKPQNQQGRNFGETIVLGGGVIGETTVLGANSGIDAVTKPYLVRAKNNERILIDKPVFRIGKEKSYVDYFIGDNTAVSRSHANIITREGKYYVVDTNSTNHTYINGQMIGSSVEAEIVHGTKIRFANEDFEFNLY